MAKEDTVINIIKKQIQEAPGTAIFFNSSFPEFDDEYFGQILSGLAKQGVIHRLSRGAIETRFGLLFPLIHEIAEAIAKRDNAEIIPTGVYAENYLGLSTQVPMKYVYLTSGSTRKVPIAELGAGEGLKIPNSSFDIASESRYVLNGDVFGYVAFYDLCVHHLRWINPTYTKSV